MKKFLIHISLFALLVLGAVFILNYLYIRNYEFETIKNVPEDIEVCNFGNSQPYNGIDYSITDQYTCFNFALPAQSFSYDLRILECYKDKLKPGAKVLICCSYHALFGKPETENDDFASKNRRYYYFLPKELIKEYDFTTDLLVRYLPSLTAGETLLPTILGVYKTNTVETISATTKEEAESTARARYENLFGGTRDENNSIIFDEEDIDCLRKMIDLTREIGCEPVLFTTPYLQEYVDIVRNNGMMEPFYEFIDEVCEEKDVQYLDYSQDERFINDYGLFTNLDHLNQKGAELFTEVLMDEVVN